MKRIIYTILALLLISVSAYAGGPKRYVLGFYNVENLFDTYHDDGKNDYEFLPDGKNKWTEPKYEKNFITSPRSSRLWQMRTKLSIRCWDSAR